MFGALDEDGQEGVSDVFRHIKGEFKRIMIISHINAIAERLSGETIWINEGQVVDVVKYKRFSNHEKHKDLKEFIECQTKFRGEDEILLDGFKGDIDHEWNWLEKFMMR